MPKIKTDLHIHSVMSDGEKDKLELQELMRKNKVDFFVTTDHDILSERVHNLSGAELSTYINIGAEQYIPIEILAYGFDEKKLKETMGEHLKGCKKVQKQVYEKLCEKAKSIGFIFEKIDFEASDFIFAHLTLLKSLEKDPRNTKQLTEKFTSDEKQFYRQTQRSGSELYIDIKKFYLTPEEIHLSVNAAGGKTFLAHPYCCEDKVYAVVDKAITILDGLECLHYSVENEQQAKYLLNKCREYGKSSSWGSDYHKEEYSDVKFYSLLDEYKSNCEWISEYVNIF